MYKSSNPMLIVRTSPSHPSFLKRICFFFVYDDLTTDSSRWPLIVDFLLFFLITHDELTIKLIELVMKKHNEEKEEYH